MSVPVGERDEGRFTLAVKAEYLARYTIEITANENVFLPEYRRAVTDDIISTAKNIYLGIREANDVTVRVGTVFHLGDFRERNRLQREALRNCKRLLYLIDLAHRIFHLSTKRVKYWGKIVKNVKDRVHGWIDDDANRYMPSE
jgi:hypothetical protein